MRVRCLPSSRAPIAIDWLKATPHNDNPVLTELGAVSIGSDKDVTVTVNTPNRKTSRAYSAATAITFSGGGVLTLTEDAATGATTLKGNLTGAGIADGEKSTSGTEHVLTSVEKADTTTWYESVGNYYRLYKKRYVVSGSATKTPRKIYWNQAGYDGPQVSIPTTTVGDLHIVYNSSFLEEVEEGVPA